jgi:hypothetical protein
LLPLFAACLAPVKLCFLSQDGVYLNVLLPAGFLNAGDLALVRKLSEADTADTVFTEISVRAAADLASVVFSRGEFLTLLLLVFH